MGPVTPEKLAFDDVIMIEIHKHVAMYARMMAVFLAIHELIYIYIFVCVCALFLHNRYFTALYSTYNALYHISN